RHPRMEEGEAAAIGIESVLEVDPAAHLVHGFIDAELLEQGGRRIPGDAFELEEADIEPSGQQRLQVGFQRRETALLAYQLEQLGAHVDQEFDPLRQGVEL